MKINKFTYLTYLVFLFSLTALGQPIKNDHSLDTLNFSFTNICSNCTATLNIEEIDLTENINNNQKNHSSQFDGGKC